MASDSIPANRAKSNLDGVSFVQVFSVSELPSPTVGVFRAIYAVTDMQSGRFYIGSSEHVYRRFRHHMDRLRRGIHHSKLLQAVWNKRGDASFRFAILAIYPSNVDLIAKENEAIQAFAPQMNTATAADNPMLGRKHSTESIEKMRLAQLGKVMPPRAPMSDAARRAMSEARKGVPQPWSSRPMPEATKAAISQAAKIRNADPNNRPTARAVQFDGIVYVSGKAAGKALGVSAASIVAYIKAGHGRYMDEPDNGNGHKGKPVWTQPRSTPVIIDGVTYPSQQAAATHFKVSGPAITYWLVNGRAQYAEKTTEAA